MTDASKVQGDDAFTEELASKFYARTKKLAAIAGGIGFVVGLGVSAIAVFAVANGDFRRVGAIFIAPFGLAAWGSTMTYATSIFFAPPWYFETSYGSTVLGMVGTKSVFVAKLVVAIFLLLGFAFVAGLSAAGIYELVRVR